MKNFFNLIGVIFFLSVVFKLLLDLIVRKIGYSFLDNRISFLLSFFFVFIILVTLFYFTKIKEFIFFAFDNLFNRSNIKELYNNYSREINSIKKNNKLLKEKTDEIFK